MESSSTTLVIVGAGPAGLLLAHYLLRRTGKSYQVHLLERRPDPRSVAPSELRTYLMGLQRQGLQAIRRIPGLEAALEKKGVWAVQSLFHQGRSVRRAPRTPFLTVDRNILTLVLLSELVRWQNEQGVTSTTASSSLFLHFESLVEGLDLATKSIQITPKQPVSIGQETAPTTLSSLKFDYLVAADGSNSAIRKLLGDSHAFSYRQIPIPDEYKTLYLSRQSTDGSMVLEPNAVHAWAKGPTRIIMVPLSPDFCHGVFIFEKGQDPFAAMDNIQQVYQYFDQLWGPHNLSRLLTDKEAQALIDRTPATNETVVCQQLHVEDAVLLIGDAAHAVSASLGQGCNSALQDVLVWDSILDQYHDNWKAALPAYSSARISCAHAVWELSQYSFPRTSWMRMQWIFRMLLTKLLPTWLASRILRPMPMELLNGTDLSYTEILHKCRWWTDRVKATMKEQS